MTNLEQAADLLEVDAKFLLPFGRVNAAPPATCCNAIKTWQVKHAGRDDANFVEQLQAEPESPSTSRRANSKSFS